MDTSKRGGVWAGRPWGYAGWAAVLIAGTVALSCGITAQWPPAPLLAPGLDDVGPLPPSVQAEPAGPGQWRCTFRYVPPAGVQRVSLAGTFNGWDPSATPMQRHEAGAGWSVTAVLKTGVHRYKFVCNGNDWRPDPENPESEDDNHGGRNSVLRLGRIAHLKTSPAQTGDGQIEALAVEHRPELPLFFQRTSQQAVLLRLRTLSHDVERVEVAVRGGATRELVPIEAGPVFTLWECQAVLPAGAQDEPEHQYTFLLTDGVLRVSGPETYGVPVSAENIFRTPDWAKHAVWYQIMVDRFRNGDPTNDRQPVTPWTADWFTPTAHERELERQGQTFYRWYVFDRQYGGDIEGLEQKLPYLKELGVNALYLLPIFKAESNHKYNAETYLHVDDHFGTLGDYEAIAATEDHTDPATWKWTETDRRFLRFLKVAHAQGFRVIIDGVFNHVGTAHPAFQDVKKNGRKSRYADWFHVTSWEPFRYEGWFGHDALPVFKKSKTGFASDEVKQYIFNVTRRWLAPDGRPEDGIDGWRLDVPNEIPAPFWVEWRQVVKETKPDAFITGEIWQRADAWLDGRHFDAVMNYEFARPTVAWLFNRQLKITPSEYDCRLRELRLAYPLEATLVLQNLLDSHDTDRVASMALNPDREYDQANRVQDNGPNYNNAKPGPREYARARLAALIQMTYIGAPMIWYGDEVGMWGADDPTCRKPMLWQDLEPYEKPEENFVMRDHLSYYRQIIALRNAHPALRTGTFRTLLTDDENDVWAFLRQDDNEQLVTVVNASDQDREIWVPLPLTAPNCWQGVFNLDGVIEATEHRLRVRVPAIAGVVLHAATPK